MTVPPLAAPPAALKQAVAASGGGGAAEQPLFRFGLLSDVQYADKEDGASFHGTPRFYRYALQQLDRAIDACLQIDVDFAIHLGDIVDYHNTTLPPCEETGVSRSEKALREVLHHFDRLQKPTLHLLGNHCLYNHPREELNKRLQITQFQQGVVPHSYYAVRPAPGWRFLFLDGYDVSWLGWPEGHPLHEQARQLLHANNPNHHDLNSAAGLVGVARRFVKFGGGLSAAQLAWLEGQLGEAAAAGERVLAACHLCFHPDTCAPACLLWNYDEVLQLLGRYAGTVVGTLAGHAHQDGMATDAHGLRHRVCKAVLETPPGRECYGIVEVFPHAVRINGVDTFASEEWPLAPLPGAAARGGGVAEQQQRQASAAAPAAGQQAC
ncbi:manganese-dependent ADP-ribose CDP-alcohol diphosphatase-like [Micractinium conductrix]|uniref:Manganese-dependent ADP-ribose CDP-alcohol diphosphatase-like n=1 Tax=Micractinium conductrix TaxID=554055 RepID=A0A2P6VCQ0_9CHLO|nr:manganese-dependent ADP-ribose CDP-alcohol diphosphatase-like [Micractinium conductrix]|eukprot:PSC71873.1 manganese-dependent ADP-ribose CDP-alcohol diphosphatase-like [Micractinium conductrix]